MARQTHFHSDLFVVYYFIHYLSFLVDKISETVLRPEFMKQQFPFE